jgi:hypothetical protein
MRDGLNGISPNLFSCSFDCEVEIPDQRRWQGPSKNCVPLEKNGASSSQALVAGGFLDPPLSCGPDPRAFPILVRRTTGWRLPFEYGPKYSSAPPLAAYDTVVSLVGASFIDEVRDLRQSRRLDNDFVNRSKRCLFL